MPWSKVAKRLKLSGATAGQVLLLGFVFLASVVLMRGKSVTFDEVTHLPSGYSYLIQHAVRYNQQHPPFIKEICALPLLLIGVRTPAVFPDSEWNFGEEFLFSQDADRILFWGRLPAVLLSVGLGLLIMRWAADLWGNLAGLFALFLYAFDPTITAHSQLVTTDIGVACFSTLYLYLLRGYLSNPGWKRLCLSGLSLGMALGSKFSAVVLLPISLVLIVMSNWGTTGTAGLETTSQEPLVTNPLISDKLMKRLGAFLMMVTIAALFLWIIYFCPTDPQFYWKGIKAVNQDHGKNPYFYLMGELKQGGWIYYLIVAWLVKTPIPMILFLAASFGLYLARRRTSALEEAFLWVPFSGYLIFYALFGDDIGIRYLIPCFPFMFIFSARLVPSIQETGRPFRIAFIAALFWLVTEWVSIMPDHLSYFNQVAGGSENGIEWLDNSNVDWGQGLKQFREYLQTHNIDDYAYCYFGTGRPQFYGINGRRITDMDFFIRPTRGLIILSAQCIPRARNILDKVFGNRPLNWLRHQRPVSIIGHAYYVYEIN